MNGDSERGIIVGLDALNGEGQVAAELVEEVQSGARVVVVVDAQDLEARGLIVRCEPVKAPTGTTDSRHELRVELD